MIDWLKAIDQQAFIFLNGLHLDSLDPIQLWITNKKSWIWFYGLLAGCIMYVYRLKSIYIMAGIVLAVAAADQLTSALMKPFFERLRPCHEPALADMVYNIGKCGGQFGFASSHAANSFALAAFVFLLFRDKINGIWLIFLWAAAVSYSRIYLGVHYPGDVLAGACLGAAIGWGMYHLQLALRGRVLRRVL